MHQEEKQQRIEKAASLVFLQKWRNGAQPARLCLGLCFWVFCFGCIEKPSIGTIVSFFHSFFMFFPCLLKQSKKRFTDSCFLLSTGWCFRRASLLGRRGWPFWDRKDLQAPGEARSWCTAGIRATWPESNGGELKRVLGNCLGLFGSIVYRCSMYFPGSD